MNLFVKEEKKDQFEQEFEKAFGGQFLLMTKDQVLESQIFGGMEQNIRTSGE
ncbi:MAG: hypothetical protein ACLUUO_10820 [Sellimonas intestinalis]